jgi:uncharacterized membrane protein
MGLAMADNQDKNVRRRRIRSRNLALLAVLVGVIVLFYLITVVRLGGAGG